MTILDMIKENARRYPEREMMILKSLDSTTSMTWSQLDDFSDYLACWIDKSLNSRTPVIVYGHKNPLMIACFIACAKSGRAYCPIDVNVPYSRVKAIINEVQPELILTTENIEIQCDGIILGLDEIKKIICTGNERISTKKYLSKDDVFYIIFTSGSTGDPKGVQITRDCLDNFVQWAVGLGNGVKNDEKAYIFVNQAPFSFDLSVMDLYLCLYTGGTLWSLSKTIQADMKALYSSLGESKANVWVSTPSFVDVCLSDHSFSQELMPQITDFLFCGEILTNKTVERLSNRFPKAVIVNTYGPTESTCAITEVIITEAINKTNTPLPVGHVKPGTWIKIVDEKNNEVKDGESGEVVIIGDSVSVGYWNNVERNKKSFGTTVQNGQTYRYYKTGDAGYIENGMLYFDGRIDQQVKLHGYRIELGDIENNLLKIKGIQQAIVMPKYKEGKVTSLVAGVVLSQLINDEKEETQKIKKELKKHLPEYMIPKRIKILEDVQRTNNGKIDRKAIGKII